MKNAGLVGLVVGATAMMPGCIREPSGQYKVESAYTMMKPADSDKFSYVDPYFSEFDKDNRPRSYFGPTSWVECGSGRLGYEGGNSFVFVEGENKNKKQMKEGEVIYLGAGERVRIHAIVNDNIVVGGEREEVEKAIVVRERFEF